MVKGRFTPKGTKFNFCTLFVIGAEGQNRTADAGIFSPIHAKLRIGRNINHLK